MKSKLLGQRDIIVTFATLLSKSKIPYLLTGSIAVSYYGRPRATHDIDFIIEIPRDRFQNLLDTFKKLGQSFVFDKNQIRQAVKNSDFFDIFHPDSGIKIDFWLVKGDFDQNKFSRKKEILINNQKIYLVSAEDIILTKLVWCKKIRSDRHLRDCAGIWQIQKDKLDKKYLNTWAEKLSVQNLLAEIKKTEY